MPDAANLCAKTPKLLSEPISKGEFGSLMEKVKVSLGSGSAALRKPINCPGADSLTVKLLMLMLVGASLESNTPILIDWTADPPAVSIAVTSTL